MTKTGMPDGDIIRRIDTTHTVIHLSADEVVRLREQGVSDRVVTYLIDSYTRYAMAQQRRQGAYEDEEFSAHNGVNTAHPWYGWSW